MHIYKICFERSAITKLCTVINCFSSNHENQNTWKYLKFWTIKEIIVVICILAFTARAIWITKLDRILPNFILFQLESVTFFRQEKRRLAINNARKQWEMMQGTMMGKTNRLVREAMPEIVANHVGTYPNEVMVDGTEENGYEHETIRWGSSSSDKCANLGQWIPEMLLVWVPFDGGITLEGKRTRKRKFLWSLSLSNINIQLRILCIHSKRCRFRVCFRFNIIAPW